MSGQGDGTSTFCQLDGLTIWLLVYQRSETVRSGFGAGGGTTDAMCERLGLGIRLTGVARDLWHVNLLKNVDFRTQVAGNGEQWTRHERNKFRATSGLWPPAV